MTQCILKSLRNICGIYKITSPSGKVYIGSSVNMAERVKHYIQLDCKCQLKLFYSFKKYGLERHKLEVIHVCDKEDLFKLERYYGDLYNVLSDKGLNLSLPGYDERKGLISEESRKKRSVRQIGNGNHYFGRKHSAEVRAKISAAAQFKSPESLRRMSDAQKGKKASDATKEKMRLSQTGRTHNAETKERMRLSSHKIKWVLCLQTGIYYLGVREAATAYGFKEKNLRAYLNGKNKNRTSLVYAA